MSWELEVIHVLMLVNSRPYSSRDVHLALGEVWLTDRRWPEPVLPQQAPIGVMSWN